MDANQQELVAQFCGVTGASPSSAQTTLASANWNLQEAVALYYAAQEEPQEDDEDDLEEADSQQAPSAPAAASSSSARRPPTNSSRLRTIRDLQGSGQDDDGDDDDRDRDLFAGGEKSGLAVQNPDSRGGPVDHFKNILNQARQNRERPPAEGEEPEEEQPQRASNFSGRAQTLGGDEAPSRVVEDPTSAGNVPNRGSRLERITRTMHLWADGVSVDDGPLFRFDDPANSQMMAQINRGQAPLSLLNVAPNQEVDLTLEPHQGENFVQPKKKWKPFGGSGQRLGSPTPGPASSSAPPPSSSTSTSTTIPATSTGPATMQIDESAPVLTLQIRLGDGSRLQSRFNTSHTIGDVYDFVNRASPASQERAYALMTTFPSKELVDKSTTLGDMSEFKRGGVVVQKWK